MADHRQHGTADQPDADRHNGIPAVVHLVSGKGGRRTGSELLFVYGEYDPTRAEPFQPGPATRDSSVYIAPTTHHLARPANLTAPDRAAALATLTRWASGQPAVR